MNDDLEFLIGNKSKRYKTNRVCAKRSCRTALSRYNPNKYCFTHAPVGCLKAMLEQDRRDEIAEQLDNEKWHRIVKERRLSKKEN